MYGEGTEAAGNVFQVSNQITMGQTEEEVLSGLQSLTARLITEERSARHSLLQEMRPQLEDRVWRAWGILTSARVLSSREAMQLISDLKLGIDLGLIDRVEGSVVNSMVFLIRPAYLQILAGEELSPDDRDMRRAALVRRQLAGGDEQV
jgi:protein arginine kinase